MTDKTEIIEMLAKLLNEGEDLPEVPREPEGFKSFISKEEFEALETAYRAWNKFIDVHNENVIGLMLAHTKPESYAMAQYNTFCECIEKGKEAFAFMYNIHKFDKTQMDELCEKTDIDLEKLVEATRLALIDAKN